MFYFHFDTLARQILPPFPGVWRKEDESRVSDGVPHRFLSSAFFFGGLELRLLQSLLRVQDITHYPSFFSMRKLMADRIGIARVSKVTATWNATTEKITFHSTEEGVVARPWKKTLSSAATTATTAQTNAKNTAIDNLRERIAVIMDDVLPFNLRRGRNFKVTIGSRTADLDS